MNTLYHSSCRNVGKAVYKAASLIGFMTMHHAVNGLVTVSKLITRNPNPGKGGGRAAKVVRGREITIRKMGETRVGNAFTVILEITVRDSKTDPSPSDTDGGRKDSLGGGHHEA
jgi:hypothetical protein